MTNKKDKPNNQGIEGIIEPYLKITTPDFESSYSRLKDTMNQLNLDYGNKKYEVVMKDNPPIVYYSSNDKEEKRIKKEIEGMKGVTEVTIGVLVYNWYH